MVYEPSAIEPALHKPPTPDVMEVHVQVEIRVILEQSGQSLFHTNVDMSERNLEDIFDKIRQLAQMVSSAAPMVTARIPGSELQPHSIIWLRTDVAFDACCGKLHFYDGLKRLERSHDLVLRHRDSRLAETLNILLAGKGAPQPPRDIAQRLTRMKALPDYETVDRATHAVTKAISELRDLLEDYDHTLIRTIWGRGVAIYPAQAPLRDCGTQLATYMTK